MLTGRLAPHFDDIDIRRGRHRWAFESMAAALHFLRVESPVHVETFRHADPAQQDRLAAEFKKALHQHVDTSGVVVFDAPLRGGHRDAARVRSHCAW